MNFREKTREFYIGTEVGTLAQLTQLDLSIFDRIYLGNPYCMDFKDNLLTNYKDLHEAISLIKKTNTISIISLIAMPANEQLNCLDNLIKIGIEKKIGGFEVHSAGILYHLHRIEQCGQFEIVCGGFANVYTRRTARLFEEMSASLIVPNYELPFEAIDSIASFVRTPLEILVHGKIPLGLSENCLLVERSDELKTCCPDSCLENTWLEFEKWSLLNFGKLTCSGRDVCLLPQIENLLKRGYRNFRISGLTEDSESLNKIGRVYKDSLLAGQDMGKNFDEKLEQLNKLSKYGFCNGYLFGKAGFEWVD